MLVFLLSLLACIESEGPSVEPAHVDHHDHHDHSHVPTLPGSRVCGDIESTDMGLEWCVRLAPGHTLSEPVDPPEHPSPSPGAGEALRCADINMLQSVALVGTPDDPLLAWCDPNLRGGPRLARWHESTRRIESEVFADESCVPSSHAMGLLPTEDGGWQASWLGRDHRDALVRVASLDADGLLQTTPETVRGTWGARAVVPVPIGSGEALLTLSQARLTFEQVVDGEIDEVQVLGEGVDAWGAGRDEEAVWVAVCTWGKVRLERVDPHSFAPTTVGELEVPCGIGERLQVATGPAGVATTWFGLEGGWLWLHDRQGTIELVHLGDQASAPTVVAHDGGWLTVDGTGQVRTWSSTGAELGSAAHPNLVGRARRGGEVMALYPLVDEDDLVLAVVGQETLWIEPHVYVYQTLELSRVQLP